MARHGRGLNDRVPEKSKDFSGAMKRLLINLNPWKFLLYFVLILAMISAIFALITPNKLSDLTDTISKGISPNMEVLEEISEQMTKSFTNIDKKVSQIMKDNSISDKDKEIFSNTMKEVSKLENKEESSKLILFLPDSIIRLILEDITVREVVISVDDQLEMLDIFKNMNDTTKSEENIKLLDELPSSIYDLVKPKVDIDKVLSITLFIAILYLSSAIFNYIQSFSMTTISNKFAKSLRTSISKKINTLPLKYFDNHETGDILSRITNDVDMIAMNLNQSLVTLVTSITLFIGSIIMMFYTNWIMAITAILSSLIGFSLMFLILGKSQKYFIMRQEELGKINGYIEEMYSGHNVVKAYNGTNKAISEFMELNEKLYIANRKSQFLSGLMHPIMGFIGNFGYVMVSIVGGLLVNNGSISFGVIIAFILYVRLFTNPLT